MVNCIVEFTITIKVSYRSYRLLVKELYKDARIERFAVIGRNKTVELENNRPLFRNKGLMRRRPNWKIIAGELSYGKGLEQIIDAIMTEIDK